MNIKMSPQRNDYSLEVTKVGDILTTDGVQYDFSLIPDGATLPEEAVECEWILGDVSKVIGEIELTLIRPYVEDTQENRFPEPLINVQDGVIL